MFKKIATSSLMAASLLLSAQTWSIDTYDVEYIGLGAVPFQDLLVGMALLNAMPQASTTDYEFVPMGCCSSNIVVHTDDFTLWGNSIGGGWWLDGNTLSAGCSVWCGYRCLGGDPWLYGRLVLPGRTFKAGKAPR